MPETTPNTDAMPDRIWVRRDDTTLGPFEVSNVADPEGLAAIEPGWTEYAPAAEAEMVDKLAEIASLLVVSPAIESNGYDWPRIDHLLYEDGVYTWLKARADGGRDA